MSGIEVEGLHKTYGSVAAVDGISFEVKEGEIFGVVGPNGAGKTTTIECLEGLRLADEGKVRVLGLDPWRDGYELRERVGLQLQGSALPDRIKVREAVELFSSFYRRHVDGDALIERLGLEDRRNASFGKLSGGQKTRLLIALALVNGPELVFFDELTTGLDPQARRAMWDLVREIPAKGATVFLTTHLMEEAEWLCDRVLIIDRGRIVALDSPEKLTRSLGLESRVVLRAHPPEALSTLERVAGVSRIEANGAKVVVYGQGDSLAADVVVALTSAGLRFTDLRTEEPSLDDVFLSLTGRQIKAEGR